MKMEDLALTELETGTEIYHHINCNRKIIVLDGRALSSTSFL